MNSSISHLFDLYNPHSSCASTISLSFHFSLMSNFKRNIWDFIKSLELRKSIWAFSSEDQMTWASVSTSTDSFISVITVWITFWDHIDTYSKRDLIKHLLSWRYFEMCSDAFWGHCTYCTCSKPRRDFWEMSSPPEASWWTPSSHLAAGPGDSPEERTSPCSFTRTAFCYNTPWNLPPRWPLGTISLQRRNLCLEDYSTLSPEWFLKVLLQHKNIWSWTRPVHWTQTCTLFGKENIVFSIKFDSNNAMYLRIYLSSSFMNFIW